MDLNIEANREGLIHHFPKLKDDETFTIESPETSGYNCIAWARGFDDRWVDYIDDRSPKKWWPSGVVRDWNPPTLIMAFEAVGFEPCGMDDSFEEGYDKAALYKVSPFYEPVSKEWKPEGWCHAAKIVANGVYHSKIGPSFDVRHRSGDLFEGTSYGEVYQIIRRPIEGRSIVDKIKQQESRIMIPDNIIAMIAGMMTGHP